jgi:hypothetical protein
MKKLMLLLLLIPMFLDAQEAEKNFGVTIGASKFTDARGYLNAGGDFEFIITAKDKDPDVYGSLALSVGLFSDDIPLYFTPSVGFAMRASPEFDIVPFGKVSIGVRITEWIAFDASYRHLFSNHMLTFGIKFFPEFLNPGTGCY